jgi:hypothetical protein
MRCETREVPRVVDNLTRRPLCQQAGFRITQACVEAFVSDMAVGEVGIVHSRYFPSLKLRRQVCAYVPARVRRVS